MKKEKETSWAEIRAMFKEIAKERKEFAKERKEFNKEFAKERKETDRQMKETGKKIDKLREEIGGISRSNGDFCEEYFINCYKENPVFMGEKFDRVLDNLKPEPAVVDDEYDLVLRNGSTIVLIEMKYKARIDDVGKMFIKLRSYRANYPMFQDYKIYLCLASFRFSPRVRARAEEKGIVLIQQRGEKIEVVNENVRTW
jgi:hypothetical protein